MMEDKDFDFDERIRIHFKNQMNFFSISTEKIEPPLG